MVRRYKTRKIDDADYIGLFTSNYDEVLCRNGGYMRAEVVWKIDEHDFSNRNDIVFPEAITKWGRLTHFGVFRSPYGGRPVCFEELNKAIEVGKGDTAKFEVGTITVCRGC